MRLFRAPLPPGAVPYLFREAGKHEEEVGDVFFSFFELVGDGFDEGTPRESRERLHHLSHHETANRH